MSIKFNFFVVVAKNIHVQHVKALMQAGYVLMLVRRPLASDYHGQQTGIYFEQVEKKQGGDKSRMHSNALTTIQNPECYRAVVRTCSHAIYNQNHE